MTTDTGQIANHIAELYNFVGRTGRSLRRQRKDSSGKIYP
jgi:hypothetical protein